MGEIKDKIKGKLIKTEGQITDDKAREAQGNVVEKKGEAEGVIDRVKDKLEIAKDRVEDKIDEAKRDHDRRP